MYKNLVWIGRTLVGTSRKKFSFILFVTSTFAVFCFSVAIQLLPPLKKGEQLHRGNASLKGFVSFILSPYSSTSFSVSKFIYSSIYESPYSRKCIELGQ